MDPTHVNVTDSAQAGAPVRDAFDSAFSEMLTLEPFLLTETAQWIENRLPAYLTHAELAEVAVELQRSEPPELRRVTGQASAFVMLSSTMGTVFDNSSMLSTETVERLAFVRRQLGVDWIVAWQHIQILRETLGLSVDESR